MTASASTLLWKQLSSDVEVYLRILNTDYLEILFKFKNFLSSYFNIYTVFVAFRFFFDTGCQVATIVMETAQLFLSQFKNFLTYQLWIE